MSEDALLARGGRDHPDRMPELAFRHVFEDEQPELFAAVEAWWGERPGPARPPRWWLRHFGTTSWVAEDDEDHVVGLALGFLSPDRADEAVLLAIAVHPAWRRQGLGRQLTNRFAAAASAADRTRVVASIWPGNPVGIRFLEALGFEPQDGPGSQRLYGVTAWPDLDGPGEDRAVMVLRQERRPFAQAGPRTPDPASIGPADRP